MVELVEIMPMFLCLPETLLQYREIYTTVPQCAIVVTKWQRQLGVVIMITVAFHLFLFSLLYCGFVCIFKVME